MPCRENSNVRRMHTAVKLNEVGDDTIGNITLFGTEGNYIDIYINN